MSRHNNFSPGTEITIGSDTKTQLCLKFSIIRRFGVPRENIKITRLDHSRQQKGKLNGDRKYLYPTLCRHFIYHTVRTLSNLCRGTKQRQFRLCFIYQQNLLIYNLYRTVCSGTLVGCSFSFIKTPNRTESHGYRTSSVG